MQPHLIARDVFECLVYRRNDAFDKAEEVAQRPVLIGEVALEIGEVALEGEIGAIELK